MKPLLYRYALVIALGIFTSCSTQKKVVATKPQAATSATADNGTADGSSYEKAIVIKEKSERSGIDAEYAWIRANYPDYRTKSQSLNQHGGKPYDILHIVNSAGTEKSIYFDISAFYGKF